MLWRQVVWLFARLSRKHKFENVFEFKTQKVYFIYPFLRRLKLGKLLQRRCVHFSSLKLTVFSEKNPYFAKHLFAKQELITRARLRGQDFATGKNFSFNQCHTKSFAFFSRESYFIKAIENFFSCVCKFSTVMQTLDFVSGLAELSRILPTSLVFISGYANTEMFSIA